MRAGFVFVLLLSLSVSAVSQDLVAKPAAEPQSQNVAPRPSQVAPTPTPSAAATVTSATSRKLAYELEVPGSAQWTDTGIDLLPGDRVTVTATGKIHGGQFGDTGPGGLKRTWRDLLAILPVNEAGNGALVGRIGDHNAAVPFVVGEKKDVGVVQSGRLFLGINQAASETSDGSYQVKINIVPRAKAAEQVQAAALSVDPQVLAQIPRRISDANGRPGDVVNILIVGSQDAMQQGFQDSGWVLVDRTKGEAVVHAIFSSLSKASYVQMPMSELYLFGRPQDFGYARAEPLAVVAQRHHLRVWKTAANANGQQVWAVAATHDMGFEKDQRTGGVTHHIDPNIDDEREFVGSCFKDTSGFTGSLYLTPADSVHDVNTATGGTIHTDGRVLVIVMGIDAKKKAAAE